MKTSIKKLTVIALLMFTWQSHAQTTNSNNAQQLKYLLALHGNWESPVTITMGDKQQKATYYADFSKTADGNGILLKQQVDIPGVGKSIATDLAGVDPYDGKVHWYTVDNMGTTHEHIGSWSDPQHFSMMHTSIREGKPYMEIITIEVKNKDELFVKQINTSDGQVEAMIEGNFHRRKG